MNGDTVSAPPFMPAESSFRRHFVAVLAMVALGLLEQILLLCLAALGLTFIRFSPVVLLQPPRQKTHRKHIIY